MSAFSARQQLWGAATIIKTAVEKATPDLAPEIASHSKNKTKKVPQPARSVPVRKSKRRSPEEPTLSTLKTTAAQTTEGGGSGYVDISQLLSSLKTETETEQLCHGPHRVRQRTDQTTLILQTEQEEPPTEAWRSSDAHHSGSRSKPSSRFFSLQKWRR